MNESLCTFPPIGTLPSKNDIDRNAAESPLGFKDQYQTNEWTLMGAGDILLLSTDGFRSIPEMTSLIFRDISNSSFVG